LKYDDVDFCTVSCKGRQDTIAHLSNMGHHPSNLRPTNMIEAMVTDTAAHLGNIQGKRDQLEAMIAEGKPDEEISLCTQGLVQVIKDYRVAATHDKKHTAKPKQAKEAREPDQSAEGAPGA
jgi:hypothetical protein